MMRYLTAATLILGLVPVLAGGAEAVIENPVMGSPKIQSIDVIAFGPKGTLLIGDGRGAQVVAIDTKDTTLAPWKAGALEKLDEKIAGRLGTVAKNIEFVHLAVNKASGKAYLALRKQDERKPLLVTIDGAGRIAEFPLDKVAHLVVPLPRGEKSAVGKITDLAWAKGRILVAALCNEEFACKVYSIPVPLDPKSKAKGFSTETYHVSHRQWETRAPMTALMPLEHKGKQYVLGAFACTPVVRYPLDDLKAGVKVKGQSVLELGSGNQPLNMFQYTKGGKSFVLMNTHRFHHKIRPFGPSPYWTVRIDLDVFGEDEKINQKALLRLTAAGKPATERVKMIEAYHGVVHLDQLDSARALVIKKDDKTGWTLQPLDLP
jgi:hypothetical protein